MCSRAPLAAGCLSRLDGTSLLAIRRARAASSATLSEGDSTITILRTVTAPDPDKWDRFVSERFRGHILQTSPWGTLKSQFGWSDVRVGLTQGDDLVAGAQILFRRLPAGLGRLAYIPKGPVVDWDDESQLGDLMPAIDEAARSMGAIALTVEPDLPDEPAHRKLLSTLGFHASSRSPVQPQRTLITDITTREDDILLAMKSKTRYNIRLAGRRGVTVREGSEKDVSAFNALLAATADRADFGIHTPAYYEAAYRLFVPRHWARLLLAEVEKEPVAGLMIFALPPRSWYFYGASISAHREKMPTYLLQWEAIRWAKSIGCATYDLWGIPDEDWEALEDQFTERSDGLWGVYRFKRGFGGDLVRSVGAWDRVYAPVRYRLVSWALILRERTRASEG
jgi:lipid II:glycine glycyltransferase (peptidoglycan interpeptide bridge formation enzyme)